VTRFGVLIIVFSAVALAARAEEIDSTLPQAKARYEKADRALNEAWAAIKKVLPAAVFEQAKSKQREWLTFRDKQALQASGKLDEPTAKTSAAYFTTAAALTQTRADWFRERTAKRGDSMTGCWLDGNGGGIDIIQRDGRLIFWLNVGRTHGTNLANTNVGDVAGVAVWNPPIGWFSDKGREAGKDDETNLSFISSDGQQLEITEANARYYQGKGVSFDGTYHKALPLTEGDERQVIEKAEPSDVPQR
jgi:uncharacterized protein YecT (DUF1311 family)